MNDIAKLQKKMEVALSQQQKVQAAQAALGSNSEKQTEIQMAREMRAELKDLQRFMKDTDKKLAKAKIPKKKSETAALKELTAKSKKLTV